MPPISVDKLTDLHRARDYKGMVRLIKHAMNVETDIRILWVSEGEGQKINDAPGWIELPLEMPPYGSDAFRKMRIDICLRKSFLEQNPFDEVSMGIAHELSHLVLDSIGHPLRRCEKAVDLTAMMLGFRRLFAAGAHKEIRFKDRVQVRQLGYLSASEVRQADLLIEQYQASSTHAPRAGQPLLNLDRYLHNLLSNWRRASLGFLSASFVFGASLVVWSNGFAMLPGAELKSPDEIVSVTPSGSVSAVQGQEQQTEIKELPAEISRIQVRLAKLGYLTGRADGRWGPKSQAALSRFKETNGLIMNDLLDSATRAALFSSDAISAPAANLTHNR